METEVLNQEQENPLEATYVTIVKDIIAKKIPEHKNSFDTTLNEINKQITGEGLFQWSSENQGAKFLAGHLQVKPELIERIASSRLSSNDIAEEPVVDQERAQHYAYFVQPSFGVGRDGSALSALDMAIARFIDEMPRVARALKAGEKPPTVDIFIAGGPAALGGEVTQDFVARVKKEGFAEYGKLYAEFVQEKLANFDLEKTRVILQGASKGAITSDLTYKYLPSEIQQHTQLLYDNPAGIQGRNLPTEIGRSINMGVGMTSEVLIRSMFGTVKGGAFTGQTEFYDKIAEKLGLEDSQEQKKLKSELFLKGEVNALAKGTPLNKEQHSFSRISTPDPVNINFSNIARVVGVGISERLVDIKDKLTKQPFRGRRVLIGKSEGKRIAFATGNTTHNFPWVRSIDSGSWARKMSYVENTFSNS